MSKIGTILLCIFCIELMTSNLQRKKSLFESSAKAFLMTAQLLLGCPSHSWSIHPQASRCRSYSWRPPPPPHSPPRMPRDQPPRVPVCSGQWRSSPDDSAPAPAKLRSALSSTCSQVNQISEKKNLLTFIIASGNISNQLLFNKWSLMTNWFINKPDSRCQWCWCWLCSSDQGPPRSCHCTPSSWRRRATVSRCSWRRRGSGSRSRSQPCLAAGPSPRSSGWRGRPLTPGSRCSPRPRHCARCQRTSEADSRPRQCPAERQMCVQYEYCILNRKLWNKV